MLHAPAPWNAVADGYDTFVRPVLAEFSRTALALADPSSSARLLDVAAGPGTLAQLAASTVAEVVAIDFSEAMLDRCRANVGGFDNVVVQQADGQALAFDAEFDIAVSMFGLMFFPDRAAGFAGMRAALRPGGTAVVSCWPPASRSTAMVRAIAAVDAAFPDAPKPDQAANPLDSAERLQAEMRTAGFVEVRTIEHQVRFTSTADDLWAGISRGFAPLALARRTMQEDAWSAAEGRALDWLNHNHDCDEELSYVAILGIGQR